MGRKRKLTAGEIALARAAFGGRIDYRRVRLVDGAAVNPVAGIAFFKGHPAITLGSTIYFRRDFCDDFSGPGPDAKLFMHEMTHVWQYRKMGRVRFLLRYARELAAAGFAPSAMYKYGWGRTRFGEAMLEAQAEMVADYSEALWSMNEAGKAVFARNLAGSGLYGL
jgi:Domain of unknown function (DUF4157)